MDSLTSRDLLAARLRAFLASDPNNLELALELTDVLVSCGTPNEAAAVLDGLPSDSEDQPGVRFRRARLALLSGDYLSAESWLRGLVADGDESPAIIHDLAFCLLCLRRADEAREWADRIPPTLAIGAEWPMLRARISLMLGDFATARATLAAALSVFPDDADLHGLAALAHLDAGDSQSAASAAEEALSRVADQHEALIVAGTLELWQRDGDRAHAHFERALIRHPGSGRALSGLGQALMFRRDITGAQDVLQRAVVAMPDHIGTWHALAWTQLLQSDSQAAEESYRAALAIDRNFGDTHGGLGLVAALRGDLDEADASIRRALRLDANAPTARYAEAVVLRARGDQSGSDQLIETLLASTGADGMTLPTAQFAERLRAQLQPR